jgi:NhaP-type Na+/H+ or K+/H+ antiporter
VVAFSILVQGLTMPWLVGRFKLAREAADGAVAAPQA